MSEWLDLGLKLSAIVLVVAAFFPCSFFGHAPIKSPDGRVGEQNMHWEDEQYNFGYIKFCTRCHHVYWEWNDMEKLRDMK